MSYHLGCTEDDVDVKKAVDEVQEYYNAQEKREWVEWAGKTLMPHLHAQIAMEKADAARAEQEDLEEMRRQDEREQQERERVEKEAELEEREAKYIRQVDVKEIDEDRFRELVGELDLERVMGESVAEGLATTQDEEVGESERDESAMEEPEAAAIVVESLTVGKWKRKAAPTRAKIYGAVDGPVSRLFKLMSICANLQCDQCLTWKTQLMCITTLYEWRCKKCQTDKSRCSWRGRSRDIVITTKRSKGELVSQADESSSGDEVQEVGPPRDKF
jgi:hypothetical protein